MSNNTQWVKGQKLDLDVHGKDMKPSQVEVWLRDYGKFPTEGDQVIVTNVRPDDGWIEIKCVRPNNIRQYWPPEYFKQSDESLLPSSVEGYSEEKLWEVFKNGAEWGDINCETGGKYGEGWSMKQAFNDTIKSLKQSSSPASENEKFHAVEYSGYWNIQSGSSYRDKNILDAEQVGPEAAQRNAELIAKLLNEYYATQTD